MADDQVQTRRESGRGVLQRLEVQIGGLVLLALTSAMALGPDAWMEWILWGTAVITIETARLVFFGLSAVLLAALIWPRVRPPAH